MMRLMEKNLAYFYCSIYNEVDYGTLRNEDNVREEQYIENSRGIRKHPAADDNIKSAL